MDHSEGSITYAARSLGMTYQNLDYALNTRAQRLAQKADCSAEPSTETTVMKTWLKRIQTWRSRRQRRSLQWWEQTRAKGKKRFVFENALTYGVFVVGATDVFDYLFYGAHYLSLGHLIQHILTGSIIALVAWSGWEAEYQKALREALSSSNMLPQSRTEQSHFP